MEERKHPDESPARAPQKELPVAFREPLPGGVERDAPGPGRFAQDATPALVARLGPGVERAAGQALVGVGDDERLVILEHRAEPVAARAGATRVVEREQDRREPWRRRAALGARGMRRKAAAVSLPGRRRRPLALPR